MAKKAAKQGRLAGTDTGRDERFKELDVAGEDYVSKSQISAAAKKEEKLARDNVRACMKKNKVRMYRLEDVVPPVAIHLTPGKEDGVKVVKLKGPDAASEED